MDSFENFEILEEIGHGGMGKVYKARQVSSGKILALKMVKENVAKHEQVIQRFQKEAQAALRLNHPNIIRTYGFGDENGNLFIAMEYVSGISLAEKIKRQKVLGVREALLIARQIAVALAYSHNLGVIHRDIKPQNILVQKRNQIKVLDFGIAKTMWDFEIFDVEAKQTNEDMLMTIGQRLGTPVYMPPEQMRNEPIDGRADIYALGATLYEMLTGKFPFMAADAKAILRQKEMDTHPGAEMLKKKCPALVAALILQMLNKERSARPRTASKLVEQIDEIMTELELLDKLRKRTGRFYGRLWAALSEFAAKRYSNFMDYITDPQVMAWIILLAVLAALAPIFWPLIRFALEEAQRL